MVRISLEEKIKDIHLPWNPITITEFNNSAMRCALFDGEYHWHQHRDADELFIVYRGCTPCFL